MILKNTLGMVFKSFETGSGDSGNRISKRISSKKNSLKKGFTLVELIVVLVVLAILAAIAVPAFLGIIDNVKNKEYIAIAESARKSTQTTLNDLYNESSNRLESSKRLKTAELANIDPSATAFTIWTQKALEDGKTQGTVDNMASYTIQYALFKTSNKSDAKYVAYDGKNWEVYDSEDDALGAISARVEENHIYMWPDYANNGGSDLAYNPSETPEEVWLDKSDDGTQYVITLHAAKSADDHGVLFVNQNTNAAEVDKKKTELDIKFAVRKGKVTSNSFPISGNYNVIQTLSGTYDVTAESGYDFNSLTWRKSTNESDPAISFSQLFSNPGAYGNDLYAWITKEEESKTITFNRSLDYFDPAGGSSVPITFRKYTNEYDNTYESNADITNGRSDYGANASAYEKVLGSDTEDNSFRFIGWAFKATSNAAFEKDINGNVAIYNGEEALWNRAFGVTLDNDSTITPAIPSSGCSFTGVVQKTKTVNLTIAEDDYTNNRANFKDLSSNILSLSVCEKYPIGEIISTFDEYETNHIQAGYGYRFEGWMLNGSDVLYDSLTDLEEYVKGQTGTEFTFTAKLKKIGDALFLKSSESETDLNSLRGQIYSMSGGDKSNIVSFSKASRAQFENAVGEDIELIMNEQKMGIVQSGKSASYAPVKSSVEKLYVLYDGSVEGYDAPVFGYTVKNSAGKYMAYWYTEDDDGTVDFESGSYEGVFKGCSNIVFGNNDLNNFNTSACTSFESFFEGCAGLTGELNISNFMTQNAHSMKAMFMGCTQLTKIKMNRTNFTANTYLEDVSYMFYGCENLTGIDLRGFGVCPNLSTIEYWFYNCKHLDFIDLSNFNTGEAFEKYAYAFFYVGCTNTSFNETDRSKNHGCSVFVLQDWNITNATIYAESSNKNSPDFCTFEYFRPNMYGRVYKNSNKYSNYLKGDKRHLAISAYNDGSLPDTIASSGLNDVRQGYLTRVSYGYFNSASSAYYNNFDWAPKGYNE